MINEADERFMRIAIEQAAIAAKAGEVPVGAVLVKDGEIISTGYNQRETGKNALAHAEVLAISKGCEALGGWRLWQCTLYVTLEPCPMCAGAIINARIPRVVFGARDQKAGSVGSIVDLFAMPYNHHPVVTRGVLEKECEQQLSGFFSALRERRQQEKQQAK